MRYHSPVARPQQANDTGDAPMSHSNHRKGSFLGW